MSKHKDKYDDNRSIEFGTRDGARLARQQLSDEQLHPNDDRRTKTVRVDSDRLSDGKLSRLEAQAVDGRDSRRGDFAGQASLTEHERNRLDFTETTVPEARTAKASLLSEGVSDWTAHFDPTLTTSEMASEAKSTTASGGARLDEADSRRALEARGAQAARRELGEACGHARQGCKSGHDEACEQLKDECDVSKDEIAEIRPDGKAVMQSGEVVDLDVIRAQSSGRILNEPPQPAPGGPGFRKPSTGRFVGYEFREPGIAQDAATGAFVSTGDTMAISKREAIARYGDPDGGDATVPPSPFDRQPDRPDMFGGQLEDELEAGVDREDIFSSFLSAAGVSTGIQDEPRESQQSGQQFGFGQQTQRDEELSFVEAEEERRMGFGGPAFETDIPSTREIFADDRDQQASLSVGMDAGPTRDRQGQIAGSADFADRRDDLQPSSASGSQTGLFEMETEVGDGQTDLFGETATESTGGEFRL